MAGTRNRSGGSQWWLRECACDHDRRSGHRRITGMATVEPAADFPEVLTTAMAAELLHVHVEDLRRMVREGAIPAPRFPRGTEIRFLSDELTSWLRSQPGHDQSPSAVSRRESS